MECWNVESTASFLPRVKYGVNSSRNPDVVPAEAGNQYLKYWIPPYQVRGRLSQARNDKTNNIYLDMIKFTKYDFCPLFHRSLSKYERDHFKSLPPAEILKK